VCGPEDAGEEHDDDDGHYDERGSDVHGVTPCVDRLANGLACRFLRPFHKRA
jgi:hypothetical protein